MSNTCRCGHKKTDHEDSTDRNNPNKYQCSGLSDIPYSFGVCRCTIYVRGNIKK